MKLLSLDVSTKTGFAIIDTDTETLIEYGKIEAGHLDEYGPFPRNYSKLAQAASLMITDLLARTKPDLIVVEQTNLGRARFTQKILEFLHCAFLMTVPESYPIVYISTSKWRSALQMKLTKEDRQNNTLVNKAKRVAKNTSTSIQSQKSALGVKGKITWKHLSVKFVNQKFNKEFKQKDNDITDAVCLGMAYLAGAPHCCGMD
jgi:hypothetical protein